jgi:hypothetical protein
MLKVIFGSIINAILRALGLRRAEISDEQKLGRAEVSNESLVAGIDNIAKANEAARKIDETENPFAGDPNNREPR